MFAQIMDDTYLPYIFFESVILLLFLSLEIRLYIKWKESHSFISKRLLDFMTFYYIAASISLLSQVNRELFHGLWIAYPWSEYFRFSYMTFTFIANYFFYLFYLEMFVAKNKKHNKKTFQIFTIIGIILSLPFILSETYRIFINLILLIHSLVLYFPTMQNSYKTFKILQENGEEPVEEAWGFLALTIVSAIFLVSWLLNMINVIWDYTMNTKYSLFWWLIWLSILSFIVVGYLGYIYPDWFRNKLINYWDKKKKKR